MASDLILASPEGLPCFLSMPTADRTSCAPRMQLFIVPRNTRGALLKSHMGSRGRCPYIKSGRNKVSNRFCRGYNVHEYVTLRAFFARRVSETMLETLRGVRAPLRVIFFWRTHYAAQSQNHPEPDGRYGQCLARRARPALDHRTARRHR